MVYSTRADQLRYTLLTGKGENPSTLIDDSQWLVHLGLFVQALRRLRSAIREVASMIPFFFMFCLSTGF